MKALLTLFFMSQLLNEQYAHIRKELARHFMVEDATLVRGVSETSLDDARYQEEGPLKAVIVAEDEGHFYLYLENCDICRVLVRSKKDSGHIEMIKQSHELDCDEMLNELSRFDVDNVLCKKRDR